MSNSLSVDENAERNDRPRRISKTWIVLGLLVLAQAAFGAYFTPIGEPVVGDRLAAFLMLGAIVSQPILFSIWASFAHQRFYHHQTNVAHPTGCHNICSCHDPRHSVLRFQDDSGAQRPKLISVSRFALTQFPQAHRNVARFSTSGIIPRRVRCRCSPSVALTMNRGDPQGPPPSSRCGRMPDLPPQASPRLFRFGGGRGGSDRGVCICPTKPPSFLRVGHLFVVFYG